MAGDHRGRHVQLHRGRVDHRHRDQSRVLAGRVRHQRLRRRTARRVERQRLRRSDRRDPRRSAVRPVRPQGDLHLRPAGLHGRRAARGLRRELHHAPGRVRDHRHRRRRRRTGVVDLHRRTGAVGGPRQARRHRTAGVVGGTADRLRARRCARAAGPTGLEADLPAPLRRRGRRLVGPPGPGRVGNLDRGGLRHRRPGERSDGERSGLGARRPRPAGPVLAAGQHHRAAVPRRHLPVLEHRRRSGRHLHATGVRTPRACTAR